MSIVLAAIAQAQALRAPKTARLSPEAPSPRAHGPLHVFRRWLPALAAVGAAVLAIAFLRAGTVVPPPAPALVDTAIASMAPLPAPAPVRAPARLPQTLVARVWPPVAEATAFVASSLPPRQAAPTPTVPKFRPPISLSQPLPAPTGVLPVGSIPGRVPPQPAFDGMAALTPVATAPSGRPSVAVEEPLQPLTELPPELQSAVQQLQVRLQVFSPQRRQRFIVVEGRQLREGDELTAGLRVDEIKETGVVLRHLETRVRAGKQARS